MQPKSTGELENVLNKTHVSDTDKYLKEYADYLLDEKRPFVTYMKKLIREKNLRQQDIFIQADVPERYGYKLLSEEKHTKQRDVILRICYASEFTLEETQRALKLYGMSPLYAKIPRDAVLMIAFNEHPGSILEVNAMLKKQNMEPLRTSGIQE
ncbi:MAG: hypothetical protein J6K58_06610 [Lachnospiraceae bacterium]|nr:hypothetical protein [Lachnospiraceae bacterium]